MDNLENDFVSKTPEQLAFLAADTEVLSAVSADDQNVDNLDDALAEAPKESEKAEKVEEMSKVEVCELPIAAVEENPNS